MTLTAGKPWGHVSRPWGYEIRVDFTDDSGGIHNEVMTFAKEPSSEEVDREMASILSRVESRIASEIAEKERIPEPTQEDKLSARVLALEAQVISLTVEKETLILEKATLVAENQLLVGEVMANG